MEEKQQFQIYSFCHPSQPQSIYTQLFQSNQPTFPTEFLRSNNTLPLCVPITCSLLQLRANRQVGGTNSIGINLADDDRFVLPTEQTALCLKAAGMDILRFVSQLTDMYNDKLFIDKNKSLSSILGQERINMQLSDIISEIRHQLTHKQYPCAFLIRSCGEYLIEYLKSNFWQPLVENSRNLNGDDAHVGKIKKKIKKQFKTGNVSRRNMVLFSRVYVADQLRELYNKQAYAVDEKSKELTLMVAQNILMAHVQHILVFLLSKVISLSGFGEQDENKSPLQQVQKRLRNEKKLPICVQYVIHLMEHIDNLNNTHKQKNSSKNQNLLLSKSLQFLLNRLVYIQPFNEHIDRLLKCLKYDYQCIQIQTLQEEHIKLDTTRPQSQLIGSMYYAYLDAHQ